MRILDTRSGTGVGAAAPLQPDQTITLQVGGVVGVPADATGVVLNVTVTGAAGRGYVTAYPAGGARPEASIINYSAGIDVANMITATLGVGGAIDLYNAQSSAHLVADVAGYLIPGTAGAPGPAGPQGPPGPAAPEGFGFDQSFPKAAPAEEIKVVAGSYDGVDVELLCTPSGVTIRFVATTGKLRFGGVVIDEVNDPNVFFGESTFAQMSTVAPQVFSGTVVTPLGTIAQVETWFAHDGTNCMYRGSVVPV